MKGSAPLAVLGGPADGGADGGVGASDGGSVLAFDWDTSLEPEATYAITASATFGEQMAATSPLSVTVDRTPPTIVERQPLHASTNVPIADPIRLVFSEPIDPATFTPSAVSLVNIQTIVPNSSQLSADGLTITISPTAPITLPASLVATLSAPLADKAGNKVAIGTWSWVDPIWVQYPAIRAVPTYPPSLAIDAATSRPVVAAVQPDPDDGTKNRIVVQATNAKATWAAPYKVPPFGVVSNSIDLQPFLALGAKGPTLGWLNDKATYVASWSPTTSAWDTYTNPPGGARFTAFAADTSGAPLLAWGVDSTYVARWNATNFSWTPLYSNSPVSSTSGTQTLLIDPAGQPAFGADALYRYVAGSWLQIAWPVIPGGFSDTGLAFCFDADGRPIMGTTAAGPSLQLIRYDANAWQPWGPSLPIGRLNRFQIASGPLGTVVAFTDSTSIVVARLTPGGIWDSSFSPSPGNPNAIGEPLNLRLVLDAAGKPSLASHQFVPSQNGHVLSLIQSNR